MIRNILLSLEFVALFILLPVLSWMNLFKFPKFFLLFAALIYCIFMLLRSRSFDRKKLWNWKGIRPILLRVVMVCVFLTAYTAIFERESLFWFPRHNPLFLLIILVLYPILSAYPQELIYRSFFFDRYKDIFGRFVDVFSILSFTLLHIIYDNWVALAFSFAGGILFTKTYRKTGSLALTALEHAIYGGLVFTLGLGKFFYERWG